MLTLSEVVQSIFTRVSSVSRDSVIWQTVPCVNNFISKTIFPQTDFSEAAYHFLWSHNYVLAVVMLAGTTGSYFPVMILYALYVYL